MIYLKSFWNYNLSDLYSKLTVKHILILSIIPIILMIALSLYRDYHVRKFKENRDNKSFEAWKNDLSKDMANMAEDFFKKENKK